jgi:hypothetical protein
MKKGSIENYNNKQKLKKTKTENANKTNRLLYLIKLHSEVEEENKKKEKELKLKEEENRNKEYENKKKEEEFKKKEEEFKIKEQEFKQKEEENKKKEELNYKNQDYEGFEKELSKIKKKYFILTEEEEKEILKEYFKKEEEICIEEEIEENNNIVFTSVYFIKNFIIPMIINFGGSFDSIYEPCCGNFKIKIGSGHFMITILKLLNYKVQKYHIVEIEPKFKQFLYSFFGRSNVTIGDILKKTNFKDEFNCAYLNFPYGHKTKKDFQLTEKEREKIYKNIKKILLKTIDSLKIGAILVITTDTNTSINSPPTGK